MANIYNNPTFLRMYWRALQELVNGPLNVSQQRAVADGQIQCLHRQRAERRESGCDHRSLAVAAQTSIAAQLAAVNATSFSVNSTVTVSNNVAYITGMAPVNVSTIWINGVAYPLTWTTLTTGWTVPLKTGTNSSVSPASTARDN